MHPVKPALNGQNAENFQDGAGKFHWREMVAISQTSAQKGFLDYQWKSPQGELKDKISYVQLFPNGVGLLAPVFSSLTFKRHFMLLPYKRRLLLLSCQPSYSPWVTQFQTTSSHPYTD